MEILETVQYRHRKNPARKVRITSVRSAYHPDHPDMRCVSFEIYDPERNEMPWRSSSALGDDQFLATYEPDIAQGVALSTEGAGLHERGVALLAELIADVETRTAPELVALRARIERALAYMDCVEQPNIHTLSHIRRMLTTDDKH